MKDLTNIVYPQIAIAPGAAVTANVTGTGVNLTGYESADFQVAPGTITDGTHTPKLQECATSGGTYTDVATTDLLGAFTALVSSTPQHVGYKGRQPYVRIFVTVSGTTSGGYYNAVAVCGDARWQPAGSTQLP
jgi:hypothetical protein